MNLRDLFLAEGLARLHQSLRIQHWRNNSSSSCKNVTPTAHAMFVIKLVTGMDMDGRIDRFLMVFRNIKYPPEAEGDSHYSVSGGRMTVLNDIPVASAGSKRGRRGRRDETPQRERVKGGRKDAGSECNFPFHCPLLSFFFAAI